MIILIDLGHILWVRMAASVVMDNRERALIFGYIREIESKWNDISIPEPIILLFILFYTPKAEFDLALKSKNMIVSGDNNEFVENDINDNGDNWKSIFGKRIMKRYGKYEWNLEIIEANHDVINSWRIMVGVIINKYCEIRKEKSAFADNMSVGLVGSEQGITETAIINDSYGELFEKVGHTIKVILDLDNLTLSYVYKWNRLWISYG